VAKFRVLRGVVANGRSNQVGDVIELNAADGRYLLQSGKVELVVEKTTNRAVGVKGSDTKATPRKRKAK
tara:strand:- start:65 stop:271 length:207 start_codon:yes stop_codon:yes gene_type:complete